MTQNIYDLVDTWNDAGVTFTAIKMNVTDTASNAASLLMDLQAGGVSRLAVDKTGRIVSAVSGTSSVFNYSSGANASSFHGNLFNFVRTSGSWGITLDLTNSRLALYGGAYLAFSGGNEAPSVLLLRDADGILAQRHGTNDQTFRLYNTYTDASNYERLSIGWDTNVVSIKPENAGTGTARDLHISGLPTSNPGPGILWNNAGTPAIGT